MIREQESDDHRQVPFPGCWNIMICMHVINDLTFFGKSNLNRAVQSSWDLGCLKSTKRNRNLRLWALP